VLASYEENDGDYIIKANNIGKVYGDGTAAVLSNSFQVKKGEVLGLLGPNGAGKSTTFNMVTMALKRSSGGIKLMNIPLDEFDIKRNGPKMGMVP
jgi:ABC-type multidrug transport system ATPase subunit